MHVPELAFTLMGPTCAQILLPRFIKPQLAAKGSDMVERTTKAKAVTGSPDRDAL